MTDEDWAPEFEPVATVGPVDDRPADERGRRPATRWIAALVVAGSVGAVAAALLAGDGDGTATPGTTTEPVAVSVAGSVAGSAAGVPAGRRSVPVTLPPVATIPAEWSVVELGVESAPVPELTSGAWVEWSIEVPGAMAELGRPADVAVLTADGELHVIGLPSGEVRSTFVADAATEGSIALGRDTVAVARFAGLALLTPTASVEPTIEPVEVPRVASRGDTGEFLVSGGRSSITAPERQWIVDGAGDVTDVTGGVFSEFDPWETQFLASGELVATGSAGVVAVDAEGADRELGAGWLVAAGPGHVAVRRCDPPSECEYDLVDAVTTTATPVPLGDLDPYRFWDTSARISPDGRFVLYADWRRLDPSWRLVDLATGSATDLGPLEAIRVADSWAPDGSGVFLIEGAHLVFHSVDGPAAAITGLGAIRSVATRPAAE